MQEFLSSPVIVNTVLSILGLLASYLTTRIIKDKAMSDKRRLAIDALISGVQYAWEASVRDLKMKSEDGKLDAAERKAALKLAKDAAMAIAQKEGFDLLKVIAAEEIPGLIHKIIARRKAGEL